MFEPKFSVFKVVECGGYVPFFVVKDIQFVLFLSQVCIRGQHPITDLDSRLYLPDVPNSDFFFSKILLDCVCNVLAGVDLLWMDRIPLSGKVERTIIPQKFDFVVVPFALSIVNVLIHIDYADTLSIHADFCPTPKRETQMNDWFRFVVPDVLRKKRPVCKGEENIFFRAFMILIFLENNARFCAP